MHITVRINEETKHVLQELKKKLVTDNDSYVVRLGIHRLADFFLADNILSRIPQADSIYVPKLPGFTVDVAKSQMMRFGLTADEYESVCRRTIDNFAASGKPMNNPEAAIYGACKRYVNEKHQRQTETAKDTPAAANAKPSYLELQDQLP